ncbi:MAG: GAF domain-containing protein [Acidothermaceae bacterium]
MGASKARLRGDELVPAQTVRALLRAISAVVGETDPEAVGRQVVRAATELVTADQAVFALLDAKGEITETLRHASPGDHAGEDDQAGHAGREDRDSLQESALAALLVERLRDSDLLLRLDNVVAVPIRDRDTSFGVLYLTRLAGEPPFDEGDERRLTAFAGVASIAVGNARSFVVGRRRERWLQTIARVATSLLSGSDLSDVLPAITAAARDIVEADGVAVAVPDDGSSHLTVQHAEGFEHERIIGIELPVENTFVGKAFRDGITVSVSALATDKRVSFRHALVDSVGPAVYVPLGTPASVRGVLFSYRQLGGRPFDVHAVDMLNAFAAQVALALELAERRNDALTIAVLEDRERIARDLHDVVIQRLFAIGLDLDGASHSIAGTEAGGRVSRAVDNLDQTINEIRNAILGLQPPAGTVHSSLRARIVSVVDQGIQALGFVPSLRFEGRIDALVPRWLADHVVAVLREALSNVAQHAQARQVEVKLMVTDTDLTLLVDDDGVGLSSPGNRSGLRNMESRAVVVGGHLSLQPREPSGTRVEWSAAIPAHG